MGNQSASRRQGDRFQDLYCLREVLRLLQKKYDYDYAWIEHPKAAAVDDLTLHPKPGSKLPTKYVQVKWHVDHQDTISFKSLVKKKGRERRSLLQSLFESWRALKREGPTEIWLVTNWSVDRTLGRLLDTSTYRLKEDFYGGKKVHKALQDWTDALACKRDELEEFCRSLRLRIGFHSLRDLEEIVDDAMQACRLRSGPNPRAIARDLISMLIENGGEQKRVDRERLHSLLSERDLWEVASPTATVTRSVEVPHAGPTVRMWVHGWAKRAWAEPPEIELDWTPYFSRAERRIPDQATWESTLLPELAAKRRDLQEQGKTFIDFRARVSLTTTLAVGWAFPEVDGFSFRIEQPAAGEIFLWTSDTPKANRFFRVSEEEGEPSGRDVLVIFSVTGDASIGVQALRERLRPTLAAVFHARPDGGTGGTSIRSAGEATALAQNARELLTNVHNRFPSSRKHLVLYSPATFSLFLGQKLSSLGEILTYEMNSEGDDYQPSVLLRTN